MTNTTSDNYIYGWVPSGTVIWPVSHTADILESKHLSSIVTGKFYIQQNQVALYSFPAPINGFIGFICLESDIKEI